VAAGLGNDPGSKYVSCFAPPDFTTLIEIVSWFLVLHQVSAMLLLQPGHILDTKVRESLASTKACQSNTWFDEIATSTSLPGML
jgi:hypothetical protein